MASKLRVNYFLPIFIGIIISFIICGFVITILNITDNKVDKVHLNDLIKSNIHKIDKRTYLKVKTISPIIAKESNKGYYIVSDGDYNYIVLLSNKKAKELMNMDLEKNPVTIYGVSREMNNKLKQIVIEKYNFSKDDNEKISLKEYYSYFGDVYLDETLALK